nr:hypothetical transcript [Hymenolepis microstoma]
MTAGVLRDILNHGKLSLRDICLLIFDECHHADPDSKSDYTDICQHLHAFPPGRWLPDYSRGPKVLGLSASLVNNAKVGEELETKIRRLEQLMRARVVTSTDSSINEVTGIRQCVTIRYQLGGSRILPGQRYHGFVQKLQNGIKTLEKLLPGLPGRDEYIDLEALLDSNKQIRKEVFLSIMELHEFSLKKLKRLLMQCLRVTEEFGVFCGAHACEQTEKALQTLLLCGSSSRVSNPGCIRVIQVCLGAISEALEEYKSVRQRAVRKLNIPPKNDPSNGLWGKWMAVNFPMSLKAGQLLWLLHWFKIRFEQAGENLSVLVIVKERITAASVVRLITEVSDSIPFYSGLKASHCVSANCTNNLASMSTGEQLDALDGFRTNKFNILVATTVVEEGLDVRACNVVIKADELTSFRSFIQVQGRARAKLSYFVLMTDDESKCRMRVDAFLQLEKKIGESLKDHCVDDSDEEVEKDYGDVTQIAKTSYMPYGIDGPRITASGASSVLMRYLGLIKTDTSYPLKILYSIKKEFGSYQIQMLLPPPSPLQDIISGPKCSNKELAKQLVRVEACKRLHEAGLLDRDLLPINFRKLISIAKNTTLSSRIDQEDKHEEMDELVNKISRLSVRQNPSESEEPLNIISQANLLLTPMSGDIFTDDSILSDPFVVQDSTAPISPGASCMSDVEEELPPGIVLCESTSLERNIPHISDGEVEYQKTPPHSRVNLLDVYDNDIVDEELPMESRSKRKRGPSNKSRFYQIHNLYSLSAPYQEPIQPGRTCYLYTWRLPSPENVATCTKVDAACFRHTNQTLGLLFSKPIAKSDFVCRVPLYMQFGIIRVRLRKTGTMVLNEEQFSLAQDTHSILAKFTVSVNEAENLDLRFDLSGKSNVTFYSTPSESFSDLGRSPVGNSSSASNFKPTDPFSELQIDPLNTRFCCLFLIIKQPEMTFDEAASKDLVTWAKERDYYLQRAAATSGEGSSTFTTLPPPPPPPPSSRNEPLNLRSGICPRYGLDLSSLPIEEWRGRLVRPINLPPKDPGGYAVSGPNNEGLCGSSDIHPEMLKHLPEEMLRLGRTSFFDYSQFKYGRLMNMVLETRGLDPSLPLVTIMRISRHQNAANVTAGACATKKDEIKRAEDRLAQLCVVHPLNTWLWLTICLTPTVLHQVYRCLSTMEFSNRLHELIYTCDGGGDNEWSSSNPEHLFPEGNFLMPDRESVPPCNTPSFSKCIVKVEGCGDNSPSDWKFKESCPVFTCEEEEELDGEVSRISQQKNADMEVPSFAKLQEAFTSVNAFEAVNLERLELLGDSFLKFVSSLYIFATSPRTTDEGQLTFARVAYISNSHLHRVAVRHGLFRYLATGTFKPEIMYTPPYYALVDKQHARENHDQRQFVKIYDKGIADSMESLLGVSLLTIAPPRIALLLRLYSLSNEPNPLSQLKVPSRVQLGDRYPSWVPLILESSYRAIDPEFARDDWESMSKRQVEVDRILLANNPKTKADAAAAASVIGGTSSSNLNLEALDGFGEEAMGGGDFHTTLENRRSSLAPLEEMIGYKFRRTRILLQAITHPSSEMAFKWGCYQRLEFLGDAILDFVVTQRIFRDHPNMNPGELTDLKIALVSNINLAVICIRKGIYKFLEHMDNNLWTFINNFKNAALQNFSNIWQLEHECNKRNESLSYKVLGDMVEAIIGAIYVDSGGVTSIVTSVIYNLLGNEIREYSKSPPMDPIRLMHKTYPDLKISQVEGDPSPHDSPSDSEGQQMPAWLNNQSNGDQNSSRTRVKVIAKCGNCTLTGEGFNLRTAKLEIARQCAPQARPYQVELAKIAHNESIIAKLDTGLGKTFIAVMVIKHHLPETFKPISQGGKRIIFIVKTVHLVYQQAGFLLSQLPLNPNEIGIFHGQISPTVWIDEWTKNVWQGQLEKHRVLVMTAGVLRDILNHGKLSLRDICLLIFDECHHADPDSKSDYTDICQHLHAFPPGRWLPDYSRGPKVLGLSASLVNNAKVGEELETKIRRLEQLMRARVVTSTDSSINEVTGIRQCVTIRYQLGGSRILPGQRYHGFVQKLQNGIKTLEKCSLGSLVVDSLEDRRKSQMSDRIEEGIWVKTLTRLPTVVRWEYSKSPPMDPIRLMHKTYPDLKISQVEGDPSPHDSPSDSEGQQMPAWLNNQSNGDQNSSRTRVKVIAKCGNCTLTGEGFNLRTAKLEIARQLGIIVC